MENITISKEDFKKHLASAFKSGEEWGVTYSTWFVPTEEGTKENMDKAIEKIFAGILICVNCNSVVNEPHSIDENSSCITKNSSWEKVGSDYLATAFNEHNKVMKMQFLEWLKENYVAPEKIVK